MKSSKPDGGGLFYHPPKPDVEPEPPPHEDYKDDMDEAVKRLRRLETRVTSFLVWSGFDPHRNLSRQPRSYSLPYVVDGAIHAHTPATSLGDIMMVAMKNNISGDVDVYMSGDYVATVAVGGRRE